MASKPLREWYQGRFIQGNHEWCSQIGTIKQELNSGNKTLATKQFDTLLKSLRLNGKNIQKIDKAFLKYKEVTELSLTGNHITIVENIPPSVSVLFLNANKLTLH